MNPEWQARATLDEIRYIFREDPKNGPVPLLEERWASVNELGRFTMSQCNGSLINLLRESKGNAKILMEKIASMKMWNDETIFQEQKLKVFKRIQVNRVSKLSNSF